MWNIPGQFKFLSNAANGEGVHKLDVPYWGGRKEYRCINDQNEDPESLIWHNGAKVSQIVANTCDEDELKKMVWSFGSVVVTSHKDESEQDLSMLYHENSTVNAKIGCEYVL